MAWLALLIAQLLASSSQEPGATRSEQSGQTEARSSIVLIQNAASRATQPESSGPWHGEPISLSLKDADLTEVLRSFARLTEANLVIDPGVQGKVTVELREVPWDQALSVILKTHGLGAQVDGRSWTVRKSGRR